MTKYDHAGRSEVPGKVPGPDNTAFCVMSAVQVDDGETTNP